MKFLILSSLIFFSACSFKKNNQVQKGHDELYAEPDAPKSFSPTDSLKRVIIASTNDVEASYSPMNISFEDKISKSTQNIEIGGVDIIGSYFKILREEYKNVVLLDSGDLFSGESTDNKEVQNFYSALKYDAMTVGLGDFNLRLPKSYSSSAAYFKDFAKDSSVPLLLSNLYELKTARVVEWKGTAPYLLKEVGGVKVGIIGLIPNDIVGLTPVDNRVGLFVENMLQSTLRHSRLLRSLGAEVIVVMTHQGIKCGEKTAEELNLPLSKVNFDPKKSDICEYTGELGEYLKRLPPNLVDVVIGGRTGEKMANYYNDILVMGGFEKGKSFNYVEFFVDPKAKKVVKEKTVVHQPVYFCREFFKETNDCYTDDASINHKERIPAVFLGKPVEADTSLQKKFEGFLKTTSMPAKTDQFWVNFVQRSTTLFSADLAFFPLNKISKHSQLMLVQVRGEDLFKILESDYNENKAQNWKPSPFLSQNDQLKILVMGEKIDLNRSYLVLSDLEGLQTHPVLKRWISQSTSKAFVDHSWNTLSMTNLDTIELRASAPVR